jgi:hypothetical protein
MSGAFARASGGSGSRATRRPVSFTSSACCRAVVPIAADIRSATAENGTAVVEGWAHLLSTIRSADVIFGLAESRIVERGTHDELMADPEGLYAWLYVEQFSRDGDQRPPYDDRRGDVPL